MNQKPVSESVAEAEPKRPRRAGPWVTRAELARVEQRIDGHEDVCAERMKRIDERLASGDLARETMRLEMKSGFSGVYARLWWAAGSVIALEGAAIAWFLVKYGLPGAG